MGRDTFAQKETLKMKSAVRWTFFLLVVVALTGLLMRALPLLPSIGIPFESLRHAHSHLAFLGWVYSAFYLAFVHFFLPPGSFERPRYQQLFWLSQMVSVGMFAAFLFQGYAPLSITFLTFHTFLAYAFFFFFIKDWKREKRQPSTWFGLVAIVSFLLSSLGPFAIPVVQIAGDGSPVWMRMAIHFYLHFHYNGWFVFGLLAIFFKILEKNDVQFSPKLSRWQWWLMTLSLVPAYFMYAPMAGRIDPTSPVLQAVGWAQWLGISVFIFQAFKMKWIEKMGDGAVSRSLLRFSLAFLFLKFSVELLAAQLWLAPYFDRNNHFLTVGYLHLLFLGSVTPFIWWFSAKEGWVDAQKLTAVAGMLLFVVGFLGSEACLFAMGMNWGLPYFTQVILVFTVLLASGVLLFFSAFFRKNNSLKEPA